LIERKVAQGIVVGVTIAVPPWGRADQVDTPDQVAGGEPSRHTGS